MSKLSDFIEEHRDKNLNDLKEFIRIPSDSTKREHANDMALAAQWVTNQLAAAGFTKLITVKDEMHPLVYGETEQIEGRPTILIYGHYDVQPPEPLGLWSSPPFIPEVRGCKLYGRGTADDKGQMLIHLKALEALKEVEGGLPINVKAIIEGEEEIGGQTLWNFVKNNMEMLQSDALVLSDTNMIAPGVPSITYGLRGSVFCQVEISGPEGDLHSGLFGGAVPNPITILAEVIARLHNDRFQVTVPGFYEDVLVPDDAERNALRSLPWDETEFRKTVSSPELCGEEGFSTTERIWCRPTLDVCGIWGGHTGEGSKAVIPAKACAKLSMRLVSNQDPSRMAELLERHIRSMLPATVKCEFTLQSISSPWTGSISHPIFQKAMDALQTNFQAKGVFIREGGSIPFISKIWEMFKFPCVLIGFGVPDQNAHAPDEYILLENFFGGIKAMANFYNSLEASDFKLKPDPSTDELSR